MIVRVLYFAGLADAVGEREEAVELDEAGCVSDLLAHLTARHPNTAPYHLVMMVAVNEVYVERDHTLSDGDVVALIPPVSGG